MTLETFFIWFSIIHFSFLAIGFLMVTLGIIFDQFWNNEDALHSFGIFCIPIFNIVCVIANIIGAALFFYKKWFKRK